MTKDERACFADAGLLSDHLDAGIIDWWDTIATHIRMQTKQSKIGTGRLGERNTIKYERSRTNIDPMWMSIDSNLLGYDIKSQVSKNDPGTLLIEVKASTFTLSRAEFYVTSNEWNVAITSGAYVFHLWCLSDGKKMLAILSPDEILPYIPTNNLDGQWETVKIPFLCFEDKFVEIACKIIKNKYESVDERLEFIANVAEATNTQKPIKDKDLIANRIEQRLLKRQLADAGIYCQIKRGEKVNKKLYPAAWQNTTNEELGQFLLSFVYQKPGTARGSKASICGNKERYHLLFSKKYNSGLLSDLLKIKAFYKLWASRVKKTDDGTDPYKVGLVNNGMSSNKLSLNIVTEYLTMT